MGRGDHGHLGPTLVVGGGIADLTRLLSDGRTVTIDAGHLVHASKPEKFINAVIAFPSAST